jgi:hypothetical protein
MALHTKSGTLQTRVTLIRKRVAQLLKWKIILSSQMMQILTNLIISQLIVLASFRPIKGS